MSTRKSKLDQLLQPSRQYKYHQVLRDASFFAAIDPQDPLLQSRSFALWKYFQIMFMFTLCLRLLVECFLSKDSPILLYMGDFKIWWGEPYLANQVVWMTAAIVVPCYQFINLCTICEKDQHWALPFQYIEGIKTGREIKLEDEVQLDRLYLKMKLNYYRSFVLQYSVIISYSVCVFVSYLLFYETYLQVFTLGIFWTLYEAYWTKFITQNMGIYPACLEILTFYLTLRYTNTERKLTLIRKGMCPGSGPMQWAALHGRIRKSVLELNDVNVDLQLYNHYWRKYMLAVFVSYVPQILFELYTCLYLPMHTSVFVFAVTLVINMIFLVSQVCVFSAVVIHKAYSLRRILNSIYVQLMQNLEHDRLGRRQLMRLSLFLEQYNFKRTGFYLLDFHLMDWNFYYNTLVNCAIYFLLITGVLQ